MLDIDNIIQSLNRFPEAEKSLAAAAAGNFIEYGNNWIIMDDLTDEVRDLLSQINGNNVYHLQELSNGAVIAVNPKWLTYRLSTAGISPKEIRGKSHNSAVQLKRFFEGFTGTEGFIVVCYNGCGQVVYDGFSKDVEGEVNEGVPAQSFVSMSRGFRGVESFLSSRAALDGGFVPVFGVSYEAAAKFLRGKGFVVAGLDSAVVLSDGRGVLLPFWSATKNYDNVKIDMSLLGDVIGDKMKEAAAFSQEDLSLYTESEDDEEETEEGEDGELLTSEDEEPEEGEEELPTEEEEEELFTEPAEDDEEPEDEDEDEDLIDDDEDGEEDDSIDFGALLAAKKSESSPVVKAMPAPPIPSVPAKEPETPVNNEQTTDNQSGDFANSAQVVKPEAPIKPTQVLPPAQASAAGIPAGDPVIQAELTETKVALTVTKEKLTTTLIKLTETQEQLSFYQSQLSTARAEISSLTSEIRSLKEVIRAYKEDYANSDSHSTMPANGVAETKPATVQDNAMNGSKAASNVPTEDISSLLSEAIGYFDTETPSSVHSNLDGKEATLQPVERKMAGAGDKGSQSDVNGSSQSDDGGNAWYLASIGFDLG